MGLTVWEVWAKGVLDGVTAPVNAVNVDTLWAWSGAESLPRDRVSWCNPLNTTEPWPGAVSENPVGVKRYLTILDGVNATVATLKNGHYPAILANLRNSIPRQSWGNAGANLGTWGTGAGWLSTNYGPPPTNLTGEDDMTPQQYLVLLQTVDGVLYDGAGNVKKDAAGHPIPTPAMATLLKASADQTAAIVAAINAKSGGTGALTDAQAGELTGILAILTKIEAALRAA